MPQLMPLYWVLSFLMVMLFVLMVLKMYGNNLLEFNVIGGFKMEEVKSKWYW